VNLAASRLNAGSTGCDAAVLVEFLWGAIALSRSHVVNL
jgi:hypothetical protein